jgi:hypothetical protein
MGVELPSPLRSSSPGPGSAQVVAAGQVSSLKMVAQLLILPVGFGRFFPRWQMAQEEDVHSRVDVRVGQVGTITPGSRPCPR